MNTVVKLLFVDDEKQMLSALSRIFRGAKYQVFTAHSGAEALELLAKEEVHVLVSDMRMPEMDGAQVLAKACETHPLVRRILLTGYSDQDSTIRAINHGQIHQYVSKPWDNNALKAMIDQEAAAYFDSLKKSQESTKLTEQVKQVSSELAHATSFVDMAKEELLSQYQTTIKMISHLSTLRTPGRHSISNQVASHCVALAKLIKLDATVIEQIANAARLYQLGKLSLPDHILDKAVNELDKEELKLYQNHTQLGAQLLIPMGTLDYCSKIIEQSHENIDGSGPLSIKANGIELGARILHMVSDYHMLINGQYLKESLSSLDALGYLQKHAGKKYDKVLCKLYEKFIHELEKSQNNEQDIMTSIDVLKPDQVVNRDVFSAQGVLLIAKGSILNQEHISKLKYLDKENDYELSIFIKATTKEKNSEQEKQEEKISA